LGFRGSKPLELHIASDASEDGMAAVAYIVERGGRSMFTAAKTRVTPPQNKHNMPRLELHALLMASRLMTTILREARELDFQSVQIWSDSMVALTWVLGDSVQDEPYVINRANEIGLRIEDAEKRKHEEDEAKQKGKALKVECRYIDTK